jgi:Fe-S-cluster-containing hydrogenase component 2
MTNEDIYQELARALNTLPQGFPATETRVEMQLLKKVFEPDEADLFCALKLTPESAAQIAERTGRSRESLEDLLGRMVAKGQITALRADGSKLYQLNQWLGIHDFQIAVFRDEEYAQLSDEYLEPFISQMLAHDKPHLRTVPIESQIADDRQTMTFDRISSLIERHQSFGIIDCPCRLGKQLVEEGCDHPLNVCLSCSTEPGGFGEGSGFTRVSKQEAYEVLRKAEEDGLVHQTSNTVNDEFIVICNCCGCCCQSLAQINRADMPDNWSLVNSSYYAEIDPDECTACGICADERCQVNAIREEEDLYRIERRKCIGCGLCTTACPTEAIQMIMKKPEELILPAKDEAEWNEVRARARGIDISELL